MITQEYIDSLIKEVNYRNHVHFVTCSLELTNGFTVQGDGPDKLKAFEKAANEIWQFASFLECQRRHEAETKVERIAKVCHEVNRAYCEANGDTSQNTWENASKHIKESAITGVKAQLEKQLSPEQQHVLWMQHKFANGWTYGEKKDETLKTHPCLIPYSMLPKEQKAKDLLFITVVRAMKD